MDSSMKNGNKRKNKGKDDDNLPDVNVLKFTKSISSVASSRATENIDPGIARIAVTEYDHKARIAGGTAANGQAENYKRGTAGVDDSEDGRVVHGYLDENDELVLDIKVSTYKKKPTKFAPSPPGGNISPPPEKARDQNKNENENENGTTNTEQEKEKETEKDEKKNKGGVRDFIKKKPPLKMPVNTVSATGGNSTGGGVGGSGDAGSKSYHEDAPIDDETDNLLSLNFDLDWSMHTHNPLQQILLNSLQCLHEQLIDDIILIIVSYLGYCENTLDLVVTQTETRLNNNNNNNNNNNIISTETLDLNLYEKMLDVIDIHEHVTGVPSLDDILAKYDLSDLLDIAEDNGTGVGDQDSDDNNELPRKLIRGHSRLESKSRSNMNVGGNNNIHMHGGGVGGIMNSINNLMPLSESSRLIYAIPADNESGFIITMPNIGLKNFLSISNDEEHLNIIKNINNINDNYNIEYVLASFTMLVTLRDKLFVNKKLLYNVKIARLDESNQKIEFKDNISNKNNKHKISYDSKKKKYVRGDYDSEDSMIGDKFHCVFERNNIEMQFDESNSNFVSMNENEEEITCLVTIDNINLCLEYNQSYVVYIENVSRTSQVGFRTISNNQIARKIYSDIVHFVVPARIQYSNVDVQDRADHFKPCRAMFYPRIQRKNKQ